MIRTSAIAVALLSALSLLGCSSKVETLSIAGGTAHIPVMEKAAAKLMAADPGIRVTVEGGGTGVGVQKVGEGLVQIGNTGRPLSDEEVQQYGLKSFAFAIDGVAVAVHPDNPVSELTSEQCREIFAGRITSWKDLGGADAPISLHGREDGSGTREVFWKIALEKGEVAASTKVFPSNGAMKTAIAGDPLAIGYLGIGHVDESVKAIVLDGVEPTQESATSGVYRVNRRLFMNTKGEPEGLAKKFIDYILSPEGAKIIEECGYIPVSP